MRDDLDIQLDDIKDLMQTKALSTDVRKAFAEIKIKMEKNAEKASIAKQCAKDKANFEKQLDLHQREIEKLKKNFKKLEKKVEDDAATLALKAEQADLEDVRDLIMALPNDEEV